MERKVCPLMSRPILEPPNITIALEYCRVGECAWWDSSSKRCSMAKGTDARKLYGLHIKNQTDKEIDICSGDATEFTLSPDDGIIVSIRDGDYLYIDQVL